MDKTIRDVFGLKQVKPYVNNKVTPITVACASLLYGLELEIEGVPNWSDLIVSGMTSVGDGSLRNNGREFLTTPATLSVVNHVLTTFFDHAKLGKENYSDRCSVHVHANCQDMTISQLLSVFLLYQLFEDLLFNFVGEERRDNIYCVPWSQTNIGWNVLNKLGKSLDHLHDWQKYTALNMLPLQSLGTIEFRHMHGTNDREKIITWCNLIGCLFEMAKTHEYEELKALVLNLNSSSEYRRFLDTVFRQWSDVIRVNNFEILLEDGVLNTKYLLTQPEKNKDNKKKNQILFNGELVQHVALQDVGPVTLDVNDWLTLAPVLVTNTAVDPAPPNDLNQIALEQAVNNQRNQWPARRGLNDIRPQTQQIQRDPGPAARLEDALRNIPRRRP